MNTATVISPVSRWAFLKGPRAGFYLALTLLTLLGGGLRLVKLGDYPGGFGQDEAVDLYDAWSLLTTGAEHHGDRWPLNSRQYGDYPSALPSYITMPFVALLGPTEFAARLPCALLNIAAIPLFGLLLFHLFRSRTAGVFAAALLAVSPWNIFFSRWAVSPGFVTFFQVAGLCLLIRLMSGHNQRRHTVFIAAGLTGFILFLWTHMYLSQYLFAPFMIGAGMLLWFKDNRARIITAGGVYSLFMILAIMGRIGNPSTAGRLSKECVFFTDQPWTYFSRIYWDYQSAGFLFNAPKMLPLHQIPGIAHIQHLLSPFYLLGLAVLIAAVFQPRRVLRLLGRPDTESDVIHWRRVSLWMLLGVVLAPVAGGLFIESLYTSRMTHLLLHSLLIISVGCASFWYLLRRFPIPAVAPVVAVLFALYLGQQTFKTVRGLARENLYLQGWLQQGVPDVMRYLGKQSNVRSVHVPRLFQGYMYHLLFTPVHPARLNRAEVTPRAAEPSHHWHYNDISEVGNYFFYQDIDADIITRTAVLRHQVRDKDRVWYELYESKGDWYVVPGQKAK